jgi:hypothetical protein
MGWRKTGVFQSPQEVCVLTCDVCERDIGHADGRRADAHYEIRMLPIADAVGDQDRTVYACSVECLRAFAAREPDPDRRLHRADRIGGRGSRGPED